MKKEAFLGVLVVGGFIVYIILINIVSYALSFNVDFTGNTAYGSIEGPDVNLGVSDSVSVNVVRNRWYGQIVQNEGDKTLYVFNIVRIPLMANGNNLFLANFVILAFVFGAGAFIYNYKIKKDFERGYW